ncbi:hypothetical protein HG530_009187 [Fusarium avenaceum]|nr:hypothetical protein HG530_009187 [Fusarium avenaceum]
MKVEKEDASSIATLVGSTAINCNHDADAEQRNCATNEACGHEPLASHIIKQQGVDGVAYKSLGQPAGGESKTVRGAVSKSRMTFEFNLSVDLTELNTRLSISRIAGILVNALEYGLRPVMLAILDEPARRFGNEQDGNAVETNEKTTSVRRGDLALPEGYNHDQAADSETCQESGDKVHSQMNGSRLEATANDGEYACTKHGFATTNLVSQGSEHQGAQKTSALEQAIDGTNQCRRVTRSI